MNPTLNGTGAPPAIEPALMPHLSTVVSHPAVAGAFVAACSLDVLVRKPGNVSLHGGGHGMVAAQFLASAKAAAPWIAAAGWPVGRRIEAAAAASWAAAGCNTNLGIVLLTAPWALAAERVWRAERHGLAAWREAVSGVLHGLTLDDAAAAFRAIARTSPGGLGQAPQEDVHQPPQRDLRAAMALAADRDSIAAQYAGDMREVLDIGLAAWEATAGQRPAARVQRVYLTLLAQVPDAHLRRKHGEAAVTGVAAAAQVWLRRAEAGVKLDDDPGWKAWDESLKADGLNPGTSADLTVAVLFVAACMGDPQVGRAVRLLQARVRGGATLTAPPS